MLSEFVERLIRCPFTDEFHQRSVRYDKLSGNSPATFTLICSHADFEGKTYTFTPEVVDGQTIVEIGSGPGWTLNLVKPEPVAPVTEIAVGKSHIVESAEDKS